MAALNERLWQLTDRLAAAGTPEATVQVILSEAMQGLGASAGAVFVSDSPGVTLAAVRGEDQDTAGSRWADTTARTAALAALARGEALAGDPSGSLTAVSPQGPSVAVLTAAGPLRLDQRVLGVAVLAFAAPRVLGPPEWRYLTAVGSQGALALDRAVLRRTLAGQGDAADVDARVQHLQAQAAQLEQQLRAQEAYVAYTEAAGTETDVLALAHKAMTLLGLRFPGCSIGYYEPEGPLWKLRANTPDMDAAPDLLDQLRRGVPLDTPVIAAALARREVIFEDGWDAVREGVESAARYTSVAICPLVHDDVVHALFALGLPHRGQWQEPDKAIVRAVGRSLTLALERAHVATHLQAQRDLVESRSAALEAFALMAQDMVGETSRYTLIQHTQELALSLLPAGCAAYYELDDGRWRLRSQVGDLGHPLIETGFPLDTPTLLRPWTTGEPFYQDVGAPGATPPAEVVARVSAAVSAPVMVNGEAVGVFALGLFDRRSWTAADRAVLAVTVSSLGLALERAQGLRDLERSNAELKASNRELEAFSYSVSHDLRAPVRHILGFSDLALRARDTLPDKVVGHLGIIRQAAERMNALIDAMLDHSRRIRQALTVEAVDLGVLVAQTIDDAAPELEQRTVEWRVQPLPTVPGDRELLRQVVVNVILNAVKFTRGVERAVIEVWAEDAGECWTVAVRDNGAGFDPAYAHKLFGVFQRLHSVQDFEGTGVGLATSQRILLRHGGDISAEGAVGQGATFRITLPKEAPARA